MEIGEILMRSVAILIDLLVITICCILLKDGNIGDQPTIVFTVFFLTGVSWVLLEKGR